MEDSRTPIAIHGAGGRMGQRLLALGSTVPDLRIAAALETSHYSRLGEDAGVVAGIPPLGVSLTDHLAPGSRIDALIDFSTPTGAAAAVELAERSRIPLVMATTGLESALQQRIRDLSKTVPVVWAPSMSLAVNLTMRLAEIAGQTLTGTGTRTDVEIIERHHRFKEDAPSGTALKFGERIAKTMGQTEHVHGREGQIGPRPPQEIGYHALRVGDNPGEHTIVFGMLGETIELTVRATNRDCYALGALKAAQFLATQTPGLYSMDDVLGL
jgi:4-hydroxy-tetrahydrodipicolinate reductase